METINIYKLGSGLLDNEVHLNEFLKQFALQKGKKILVHGGGKAASVLNEKLGNEVIFHEGRRVTDANTLDVVTMVYAGKINKNLVAKLQANGCNAIGLSGVDGNVLQVVKRPATPIDFGFVGNVLGVNGSFINLLLDANIFPVFCSIAGDQGQLLNINADTIATEIAIELSKTHAVSIHYLMDKPGVLQDISNDSSVIEIFDSKAIDQLLADKIIDAGMLPKMENAIQAKKKQVNRVIITSAVNVFDETALKTEVI